MIAKIHTVTLYVSDQDKARDFYVDKLGLQVIRDEDMGPMGRWLEVSPAPGTTAFMLANAAGFGQQELVGRSAHVVLHTDDIVALHHRLTAAGVPVTEPETKQWGTFVKVTDPDGTDLVISQPR